MSKSGCFMIRNVSPASSPSSEDGPRVTVLSRHIAGHVLRMREFLGTQEQVARWLGLHRDTLSNYERDNTEIPARVVRQLEVWVAEKLAIRRAA